MTSYTMTINGLASKADEHFSVINPATADTLALCPQANKQEVHDAVMAARQAFSSWSKTPLLQRRKLLSSCADALLMQQGVLIETLVKEQGKPFAQAQKEVETGIAAFVSALERSVPETVLEDNAEQKNIVLSKALGVVAIITPWNFPFALAAARVVEALLMGDTVVVKPSPYTPLTTLLLGEYLRDILPAGVINVIAGGDQPGVWLTEHDEVNKICFTGSVSAGKAIAQVAAKDLKRVTLEMGGNDPAIVMADVSVDEVAEKIFWGAFGNCGQICVAIKRLFVHQSIFEPLVERLVALAKEAVVGNGLDEKTTIGPLNNEAQLNIVSDLVEDAKANNAVIRCGGERLPGKGFFYAPTIVTGIAEGVRLVDEEQFGPVLPIMPFDDLQDAVERANNVSVGLGASVWGEDWQRAAAVAEQLEAGVVWVNTMHDSHVASPFGGMKSSGIGRVGGQWGLSSMSEVQAIHINKLHEEA